MNHTKTAYSSEHTGQQITSLISLFLLVLGGLIIGEFMGIVIIMLISDGSLESLSVIAANPGDYFYSKNHLLILHLAKDIFGFMGAPLLYLTVVAKKYPTYLFHEKNLKLIPLLVVACIALCVLFPNSLVIQWNMQWDYSWLSSTFEQWARAKQNEMQELTKMLTTFNRLSDFLSVFFVVSIIAGITEEIVFRGIVQPLLTKITGNHHIAIWLAASVFSAIHMEFYGFVPLMLLGALYGYLFFWSGNIIYPIIAHMVNNGFIIVMTYLYQQQVISLNLNAKETLPLVIPIFMSVLAIVLLYYFRHFFKPFNSTPYKG